MLKVQSVIKEIAHLVDMPLPWAPKLFIDKDKFLRGPPMGEVTRFYYKSRVDIYTKYMQIDGYNNCWNIYTIPTNCLKTSFVASSTRGPKLPEEFLVVVDLPFWVMTSTGIVEN